jgi:hypothetical protein
MEKAAQRDQCGSPGDLSNFVRRLRPGDPSALDGKELGGDDQLTISYFDVFVHVVYEAAPPGAPKPIADAEFILPEGPAKKRCFCPCYKDDLAVTEPGRTIRQFCLPMKKRKPDFRDVRQTSNMDDISDRIIAHLTREYGGNMRNHNVVDVTSGSSSRLTSCR